MITSKENQIFEEIRKHVPVQWIMDKYAKNMCWSVCKFQWNNQDSSIDYEITNGPTATEMKHVTYEDICKEFHWKSFKVKDSSYTIPNAMTPEEIANSYSKIKKLN